MRVADSSYLLVEAGGMRARCVMWRLTSSGSTSRGLGRGDFFLRLGWTKVAGFLGFLLLQQVEASEFGDVLAIDGDWQNVFILRATCWAIDVVERLNGRSANVLSVSTRMATPIRNTKGSVARGSEKCLFDERILFTYFNSEAS